MKIDNFSSYEIYPNEGKIWSCKSNRFIGCKNKGYWLCSLYGDEVLYGQQTSIELFGLL